MAKIEDMKHIALEKIIRCGFVFMIGIITLIALCFNIYNYDSIIKGNGFAMLSFNNVIMFVYSDAYIEGLCTAIGVLCWLQLIYSLIVIIGVLAKFFFADFPLNKTIYKVTPIICLVFLVLYMIEGIVFSFLYPITTFTYIPFILGLIVLIIYKIIFIKHAKKDSTTQNTTRTTNLQSLEELYKLYEAGILTDKEYQTQKEKILGGK